jgi:hypothetical protein
MDVSYDNYNNFSAQHASPNGRTLASINYTHNFYPYKPCSYCSNPYHSSSNCPSRGQGSNFSYEQMNTNFSSPDFDSNSNVYNSDWSNHSNFSWQAQAMRNCAPQPQELHHLEYSQFNHQSSYPSSYNYPAQKLSLEDTLKAFIQESKQNIQELRSVQANFSNTGFDSNSSFYNPDCSNRSDFSWQDQATGNYAPLHNELHHLEYLQFKNQVLHPSSYDPLPKKLSLEETLQAFIQTSNRNIQELKKVTMSNDQIMQELKQSRQELKNATMSNSQAIKELTHEIRDSTQFTHQAFAKKEEQIDYLVVEFNRMEEEELQSQLMAEGHYKIDEDDASHSYHENIPDTIILESNEIDNNEERGTR